MEVTILRVIFLFAMVLPVVKGQYFGSCGERTVTPVQKFNYEEFADSGWRYKYVPETSFYDNIRSVNIVMDRPFPYDCAYRATLTINRNDGSQEVLRFREQYLGKGFVYETQLDKYGALTSSTYQIVFFSYKPDSYTQFYICSYNGVKGGNQDYRFVLVKPGYRLTKTDIAVIKLNDKKQNFRGKIRHISTSEDNYSDSNSDSDSSDDSDD